MSHKSEPESAHAPEDAEDAADAAATRRLYEEKGTAAFVAYPLPCHTETLPHAPEPKAETPLCQCGHPEDVHHGVLEACRGRCSCLVYLPETELEEQKPASEPKADRLSAVMRETYER